MVFLKMITEIHIKRALLTVLATLKENQGKFDYPETVFKNHYLCVTGEIASIKA